MFDFKFDWTDDMNTGILVLDEHNKELFRIGRDIEQIMLGGCVLVTEKELLAIVCALREYIAYHFYMEEKYMRDHKYEWYKEHISKHQTFGIEVMSIDCPALGKNPRVELPKIKDMIQKWIFEHVLIEDMKAADILLEK